MKAVGVIILSDDQKQILLSKRSQNEESEIGKWENVGGKLEENESFEEAAIREVKEELGVEVKNMKQKLKYGDDNSDFCIKVFVTQIQNSPRIMEPFYCDQLKWFNIEDLGDIDLASYSKEDFRRLGWIKTDNFSSH